MQQNTKKVSYWIFQLQISQLCNETTHDKVAPTKQNLICRGKSAIEIIKMRGEPQSHRLRTPGKGFFFQHITNFLANWADWPNWLRDIWGIFGSTFSTHFITVPKVVLVLRKVAWVDPWVITITTQGSAHATLHSTRTTLLSFV